MKKVILIMCFIFGASQFSQAQVQFGIKGGINYNSDSFQEVKEDVIAGAKSKTGFHAGIWTRFKIPVIGFYLRPELVYTSLKSEINTKPGIGIASKVGSYNFQKIDVPILLGKKFLGVANVFIGPSLQYIIDGDFNFKELSKDIKTDASGFTAGLQLGAGIELGNFGLDVRWERGFSDIESSLINKTNSSKIKFDTRVNQIIVGVSVKF